MKKYLINGMAVLAMGMMVTSCSKDNLFTDADAVKHAESVLGVTIDPNQDWKMTQEVTANVTVNMGTGEKYTVAVYDKNPMNYSSAIYYSKKAVSDGGTVDIPMSLPKANDTYYVAIYDSHNRYLVKQASVVNNTLTTSFGEETTFTRSSGRRAIQPSFNFPSDAEASKFLADVPEGIEKLAPGIGKANHYIDETYEGDLNVWGIGSAENGWVAEGGTLYVKGDCDFSNRSFYFAGNSELYLVDGATLTLNANNSANLQTNTKIYIAEGAQLIANGELKLNNGLQIFNHGTIEAPALSTNSNSVLYNKGTVTIEGKISVENTESVIVNDATMDAADLQTAGSGKFLNTLDGVVTITNNTIVNSNNNTWVNNGHYHTGYFYYQAASDEVINNCMLTVDEDFSINLGDNPGDGNFKMDAGAGVVTKNFNGGGNFTSATQNWVSYNGGPFYIYMGAGSVFKVTETATMNATKADYGIYGPESGDYAVFEAKNIVAGKAEQGYEVTYGNNLAVVCETHFENGMSGQYPYIDFKGNATIYKDGTKPAITIEKSNCNPGFTPGEGKKKDDNPAIFSYAFEDSWYADYDMNDVVVKVSWKDKENEPNTVNVTLCCTGATYNLYLYYGNEKLFGGDEVHAALGGASGTFINTLTYQPSDQSIVPVTKETTTQEITVPEGTTLGELDIWIKSPEKDIHVSKEGEDPHGVVIPEDWQWPMEWVSIKVAYPDFVDFAKNQTAKLNWYEYPTTESGKIYGK